MNRKTLENTATFLLCSTILMFLGIEFVLNLTPPISRDALIHHLAIPKLWFKHGGFYEIPWADYSYYPMYINLLYLVCLYFKNDIAPKFIHLAFGFGTGWLIFIYLKKKFDRNWGLPGHGYFYHHTDSRLAVNVGLYRFRNDLFYDSQRSFVCKVA